MAPINLKYIGGNQWRELKWESSGRRKGPFIKLGEGDVVVVKTPEKGEFQSLNK